MSSRTLARLVRLIGLVPLPIDPTKLYGYRPDSGWQEVVIPTTAKWTTSEDISSTAVAAVLADVDKYKRFTGATASTYTIPANATVAFPVGAEIHLRRAAAANNLTVVAASGVTINAPSGGTLLLGPRMTCTIKKVGTNEWDLIGQTVAV